MNLNANGEWDAEGRTIVNCSRVETVVLLVVERPPGTPLPVYGVARNGNQIALMENGVNISEWTPVTYPQGTGAQVTDKRRLARLGQNNVFTAGSLALVCEDPTIGAGGIFFVNANGSPVSPTLIPHSGPGGHIQINFACTSGALPFPGGGPGGKGSTYGFICATQPGENAQQFAQRMSAQILADPLLQGVKIGSQWPSNPNGVNLAVTFDGRDPPIGTPLPMVMQVITNSTNIPSISIVQQPGNILDAAPVFVMHRVVTGRTPRAGDNIGQIWFGGMTNTGAGPTGYVGFSATIRNPAPLTLTGELDGIVRWGDGGNPSTHRGVFTMRNGIAMWSLAGVQQPFLGFGKVSQTP